MIALFIRLEILMYDTFKVPMEHYIERWIKLLKALRKWSFGLSIQG